jgi:predicted nucleic acid-binding Zn ribbon protein
VLGRIARETQSGRVLEPLWREAAGELIADKARPIGLERGCLWVSVPSARWATELERQSATLRDRLRSSLGEGVVDRIAFKVG